ncbi:hypothetical protein SUGI_0885150 [Cryptomeria japonica]|nr:hypothetical protein SUGI_0885150 [Cryptomeria japonica]
MESIPGALYGRGVVKLEVTGLNSRSPPKLLFSHRTGPGLVSSLSSTDKLQIVSSRVCRLVKASKERDDVTVTRRTSAYIHRICLNIPPGSVKFRRRKFVTRCESEGSDSLAYADRMENNNAGEGNDKGSEGFGEGNGENYSQFYGESGGEALGKSTEIELTGDAMGVSENVVSSVAMASNLTDDNVKNSGRGDKEAEKGFEEFIRGEEYSLESTKESLEDALKKLADARKNSNMFEEKAQRISEMAIALRDEATEARKDADDAIAMVQQLIGEEIGAEEAFNKAKMAVSVAETQTKLALAALQKAQDKIKEQVRLVASSTLTDTVASTRSGDEGNVGISEELSDVSVKFNGDKAKVEKLNGHETYTEITEQEDQKTSQELESSSKLEEEIALDMFQDELRKCEVELAKREADLHRIQSSKLELQVETDCLSQIADKAETRASQADEDVANVMALAEEAVALELEAAQCVSDAQLALQRAEKCAANAGQSVSSTKDDLVEKPDLDTFSEKGKMSTQGTEIDVDASLEGKGNGIAVDGNGGREEETVILLEEILPVREETYSRTSHVGHVVEELDSSVKSGHHETFMAKTEVKKDIEHERVKYISKEAEQDKSNVSFQQKKMETSKDVANNSIPKTSTKKSSRFFSASFFSFEDDGAEFTPGTLFSGFVSSLRNQLPKLVVGVLLLGAGVVYVNNRMDRGMQVIQPTSVVSGIEEVTMTARPFVRELHKISNQVKSLIEKLPHQEVNEEETSLFDMLWLLLASVIFVPLFQKIPGGSPVLGYLAAGILIGPYGLSIIRHVHGTKAVAEFGVVFLLFNIGLELSVERLSSMKKYVFGLGSAQVFATAIVVGLVAHFVSGQPGPAAIVIGNGLALSSTAVVLQVLQERGESTSRHGRATFSVLLFQDLAVVVLLILIPLISPNSSKGGVGFQAIAEALGIAAVKAIVAISGIIAGGRLLLRPIYKQIAENQNAEIFSANTLLVVLGTSVLTARAGLSMALGAFLAGLLLAETEFSLQVESDIAPYRGLLLGLFFMTVGMSIDPKLLVARFPAILGTLSLLIGGKTVLVALVGRLFGISTIAAIRVGLLLAPGGEFAFVAFGEAVNQGIMSPQLSSLLFLVVGLSMAITPWLAAGGQLIASRFEQHDVRSLLPAESETDDLQDHIIICGFGRVGQIIAQLLSERLIPFVALDVRSERVAAGRALDLPVYFGDAGSREVLHKVGAERAAAAAITLDTPGANYRTVWALSKNFPHVKTFVRAHDVDHGVNLEKAGATAVIPETLEPSLQLAAALLAQAKLPASEIAQSINEFRSRHLSELTEQVFVQILDCYMQKLSKLDH